MCMSINQAMSDKRLVSFVFWRGISGDNVTVSLLGGSISLRGWNSPDESYITQVHKWLELVMVEGCR